MTEQRRSVDTLVGEPLSAVSFVMNYVEFHFNGPVLRALASPRVAAGDVEIRFGEAGSRDALCSLIGATVSHVEVDDDAFIRLRFEDGRSLTVPLDGTDANGPEAAHFQGTSTGPLDVW